MKRLGFGTLRLPMIQTEGGKKVDAEAIREMVDMAVKLGVQYFDCAPTYCEGQCEQVIGQAVKHLRNQICLASKIPLDVLKNPGDLIKFLRSSLERLQTDYLDYYYFWGIKKAEFEQIALKKGFLKEMKRAKEEGLIHNMGFSFHDKPEYAIDIVNAAKEQGCSFDMMMCQYNLIDRRMEPYFKLLKEERLKVFIMGAAAGGKLEYESAYSFVWNNAYVDCLVSGFQSSEMVKENSCLLNNHENIDLKKIEDEQRKKDKLKNLYCTGCGYCMPCPMGINIPKWMDMQQRNHIFGQSDFTDVLKCEYVKNNPYPAEVCIDCGSCEQRCPQGLEIRNYIKEL